MAIQTVKATINGQQYTLTYDEGLSAWTADLTAPGSTSFNQPGGYYDVSVIATNTAGTSVTVNAANNDGCKLVVKEVVKPVVAILQPTSGAYTVNNLQTLVFNATDEAGGSGINDATVVVTLDGSTTNTTCSSTTAITDGKCFTYTPTAALSDGSHTYKVTISDNDGNASLEKTTTFTVDTVAPTLNVTSPAEGLITSNPSLVVAGTTNDITSSPVTLEINGATTTVQANGSFSQTVMLSDGENTITVVATDAASKATTVTRHVTLDTSTPTISSVVIAPNPANTGDSMIIKVTVA